MMEPQKERVGGQVSSDRQAADRAEALLTRMSLAEKAGQMTLVDKTAIREEEIAPLGIGALLSGGGVRPEPNTPEAWATMVQCYQTRALESRLKIPLLYGVDAVHGHGGVRGATIFPHNIGLGASRDVALVEQIGRATAEELVATGICWNYAPMVAVPRDIRWGRTYEGFSEVTELVTRLSAAYLRGLQGAGAPGTPRVLGTPKHYVGDGGTTWGSSKTFIVRQYMLDQGVTEVDESILRSVHLPPYIEAIRQGARCIMVSFSSWGGLKMHAHRYLLSDVLKGELGFNGFLVSDWQAVDQIAEDYYLAVVSAINAGVDMVMVPYDYQRFIAVLTQAVEQGDLSIHRVDDAVRRILKVKFELGLFERPCGSQGTPAVVGSPDHQLLARRAVQESLVLLKNRGGVLPLAKEVPTVLLCGSGANDIGLQCGGWTIEWHGKQGPITPGTTILEGIQRLVGPQSRVLHDPAGNFADYVGRAEIGIAVCAETPAAEGLGDRAYLDVPAWDEAANRAVRTRCEKLVVILLSGRPQIVAKWIDCADALVAAWLPGTEGQGVADVLFGEVPFTGRLPYSWPRSMDQIPFDFDHLPATGSGSPLFPYGFALAADEVPDSR